jgi:hypothetical protein
MNLFADMVRAKMIRAMMPENETPSPDKTLVAIDKSRRASYSG